MKVQLSDRANRIWSAIWGTNSKVTTGVKPRTQRARNSDLGAIRPALDRSCLLTIEENPPRRSLAYPNVRRIHDGTSSRPGLEP